MRFLDVVQGRGTLLLARSFAEFTHPVGKLTSLFFLESEKYLLALLFSNHLPLQGDYKLHTNPVARKKLIYSAIQTYTRRVTTYLPTREQMKARERLEKIAEAEQRRISRALLFGKGDGNLKKLSEAEKKIIRSTLRTAYENYLKEFPTGKGRKGRPFYSPTGKPLNYRQYRVAWWKGNRGVYFKHDVPRIMKEKMEALHGTAGLPE